MRFCGAKYHCLSQSSDGAGGLELCLGMNGAAQNRDAARAEPSEIFCADAARCPGAKFVNRTVLKKNQRLAGLDTVKNHGFMMYATIQVGLQIGSHNAVNRSRQQAEDHAIG